MNTLVFDVSFSNVNPFEQQPKICKTGEIIKICDITTMDNGIYNMTLRHNL